MQCLASDGMWRGRGPVTWVRWDSSARRAPGGAARTVVTHLSLQLSQREPGTRETSLCHSWYLLDKVTLIHKTIPRWAALVRVSRDSWGRNPLAKSVICGLKSCKKYLINRSNKKQMNVLMEETSVSVIRRPSRQLGEHYTHSSPLTVPSHFFLISAILASLLFC